MNTKKILKDLCLRGIFVISLASMIFSVVLNGCVKDGENGADGKPGSVITIGTNGNWFIDGEDTGQLAVAVPGLPGSIPEIGENGNWWIDGVDTGKASILIPEIGENGNWWIDGIDTNKLAQGPSCATNTFVVTFDPENGSPVITQSVLSGGWAVAPTREPARLAHVFDGWYTVNNEKYIFETPVTGNITLYAKWIVTPLVESIFYDDVIDKKFEFDEHNRFTKVTYYFAGDPYSIRTFKYGNDNNLIELECENFLNPSTNYKCTYSRIGNKISGSTVSASGEKWNKTIYLDLQGLPVKIILDFGTWSYTDEYQYQNGNLTEYKRTHSNGNFWTNINDYEDELPPFYHCKSPKWIMLFYFSISPHSGIQSNITTQTTDFLVTNIAYEYDINTGLPVSGNMKCTNGYMSTIKFTYLPR